MTDLCYSTFLGNIATKPEIIKTSKGAVLSFSLAVTKKTNAQKKTCYHRLVWFFSKEEAATQMAEYLTVGRLVHVFADFDYSVRSIYSKDKKEIKHKDYSFIVREVNFLSSSKNKNKQDETDKSQSITDNNDDFESETVAF